MIVSEEVYCFKGLVHLIRTRPFSQLINPIHFHLGLVHLNGLVHFLN